MFGVRVTTVARWLRLGRLDSDETPVSQLGRQVADDAIRLYAQGWSIRQVAEKFDLDYSTARRLLRRNGVRLCRQRGAHV